MNATVFFPGWSFLEWVHLSIPRYFIWEEILLPFSRHRSQAKSKKKGNVLSKKSPTGPAERTAKPEYLIALATYLGVRW